MKKEVRDEETKEATKSPVKVRHIKSSRRKITFVFIFSKLLMFLTQTPTRAAKEEEKDEEMEVEAKKSPAKVCSNFEFCALFYSNSNR